MNRFTRRVLFFLFFVSGFASLVYQVVWTRLAFASFGIITPVLSVVLSVFMLGLALGSWGGGRIVGPLSAKTGRSAIIFYGVAEMLIGLSAFAVPKLFAAGEHWLLTTGETDSFSYLFLSALVLAASILPWCVCMGATFPLVMAYIRELDRGNRESFSYLYLANVLGAMSGTLISAAVLIELWGFHQTLWLAAACNFTIGFISFCLGYEQQKQGVPALAETGNPDGSSVSAWSPPAGSRMMKSILFTTGFVSMAMEVVWTRAFTPVLKTQVYSFASIVFTYLGATFLGSLIYRRDLRKQTVRRTAVLIACLIVAALLPVLVNDPRRVRMDWGSVIDAASVLKLLASIAPFCAILGYLTPRLVDECAAGQPAATGKAYAINVIGCILGPLCASYVLLPYLSEKFALLLLGLPLIGFYIVLARALAPWARLLSAATVCAGMAACLFYSKDFEDLMFYFTRTTEVRRDYAASAIATGTDTNRVLLVNGIGMTRLTPITKFMAHLPLAFHAGPPRSALIICFGMGTTYRSALSWNIQTTDVELVPGVKESFGYFHADAARVMQNSRGRIIIDDGRRYLRRIREKFDVILVDPPPPVETAGSSLLYSTEFYELAKQRLNPHGILQIWYVGGDGVSAQAAIRSVYESFPYVRCFYSVERWGLHVLASMEPIEQLDAAQLVARMPESAQRDLIEWNPGQAVLPYIGTVVANEVSPAQFLNTNSAIKITDDHPYNEYFLVRRLHF